MGGVGVGSGRAVDRPGEGDGDPAVGGGLFDAGAVVGEEFEAAAKVGEAGAVGLGGVEGEPVAGIGNGDTQFGADATRVKADAEDARTGFTTVFAGVFEKRKNEGGGGGDGAGGGIGVDGVDEAVFEAGFFEAQVAFELVEFDAERGEAALRAEGVAEVVGEFLGDAFDGVAVVFFGEDGVEGVEEKVRVDLGLELAELGGAGGGFEAGGVEFGGDGFGTDFDGEVEKAPAEEGEEAADDAEAHEHRAKFVRRRSADVRKDKMFGAGGLDEAESQAERADEKENGPRLHLPPGDAVEQFAQAATDRQTGNGAND